MNETEQTRIMARIRKMMRLANDAGATEGERDNAMRMVHATLAKYNLDMAQVGTEEEKQGAKEEPREKQDEVFYGRPWARQVCYAIARLYFCHYWYNGKGRMARHTFVGRHSNCVTAREMSKWLVEAIHREATRFAKSEFGGGEMRRSFGVGAAHKIRERCDALLREAQKPPEKTPGTTVMLLSNVYALENKANEQFIRNMGVTFRTGRAGKSATAHGYEAGSRYGASVSLHGQVGRSSSTKLIK